MGNDSSVLSEYQVDDAHYAQLGPWTLHSATKKNSDSETVSVFTGKLKSYGQLSKEFQRAVERLKTLRHPSILKYLNSCIAGETVHLFVEYVTPLSQVLPQQTELEICCGLQNILSALDFIHSKASIVHNNLCKDAIFVTTGGDWKLGYFDLACSFAEVTEGFLDQIRSFRYEKAIAPEDEKKTKFPGGGNVSSRDIFAFGQLVKETISKCVESGVTDADVFRDLANKQMQSVTPQSRPTASVLSRHKFFDQPLLHAQEFLAQISIKSQKEKDEFFRDLPTLLYSMSESVVGCKLASSLLSRLVVLSVAAQQHLLPHLLIPRTDSTQGLFDASNYRLFVLPVVSRIFPVRDAQIRLVLLHYFPHFVGLMEPDHLVHNILPELLLGIKDTDDTVVAATLKALACLVPILGGSTVIGGTRLKLFTNGMPKESEIRPAKVLEMVRKKSSPNAVVHVRTLPERHEPDGGEDGVHSLLEKTDSDEHWSDWEAEGEEVCEDDREQGSNPIVPSDSTSASSFPGKKQELQSPARVTTKKPLVSDLSALEIQIKSREDEIDYFADMEPTITSTPAIFAPADEPMAVSTGSNGLDFNVQSQEEKDEVDGWNWDD